MELHNYKKIEKDLINDSYLNFLNSELVSKIIEQLPYKLLILNDYKQIIYANKSFLDSGKNDISEILSLRPGEAIKCENSTLGFNGCGTHNQCKYYSINIAFENIKEKKRKSTTLGQLYYRNGDFLSLLEYEISGFPLEYNSKNYYIISLFDISKDKENEMFQRLFFHDVLNIAGSLQNIFRLLNEDYESRNNNQLLKIASTLSEQLTEEIVRQRDIIYAEKGKLSVKLEKINTIILLDEISKQISQNVVAKNKKIIIDINSVDYNFTSDRVLLVRVLTNMIKNALEADNEGTTIIIGTKFDKEELCFWVHNNTIIEDSAKHKIFKKAFSTKEVGRGYGTYSIKLLSEKYLNGNVFFESKPNEGTIFGVRIKLH